MVFRRYQFIWGIFTERGEIMTDIFIDPTKSSITIKVTSKSLHAVGFEITVFDSDGSTVMEQFTGNTQNTNPYVKTLQQSPSSYKGKYIRGTFTVQSPDGTDYPYSVIFSILEDNIVVNPEIPLAGSTTNGQAQTIAVYYIK